MKIYTKTGDKGTTGLYGGKRVAKHHERIMAYGDLDELNAHIGHLRDKIEVEQEILLDIQHELFNMGAYLATPEESKKQQGQLPKLNPELVAEMEKQMDAWNEEIPPMTHFILPGGHVNVSYCHIVRTIARRAERNISLLSESLNVSPDILIFVNRLSDYLFVMARKLTYAYQCEEVRWIPRK